MPKYRTELVSGHRVPYHTWTFAVVPPEVRHALGGVARIDVRGTISGAAFRSTISRGEGVYRFPVIREVREAAGVGVGDVVDITLEVDTEPRPIEVPSELRKVLQGEGLWKEFGGLAPSLRRAWAQHVAEAKKPETRMDRARRAPAAIRARLFPGQR
jgi:hypothetical protein